MTRLAGARAIDQSQRPDPADRRRRKAGDRFQIIAGERRWRAAQARRPARAFRSSTHDVRDAGRSARCPRSRSSRTFSAKISTQSMKRWPIAGWPDEFQLTQEADRGRRSGKDRASVANHPPLAQAARTKFRAEVAGGRCSMGHARALLSLTDEADQRRRRARRSAAAYRSATRRSLVKKIRRRPAPHDAPAPQADRRPTREPPKTASSCCLGTRVRIVRRGQRGRIEIDFD